MIPGDIGAELTVAIRALVAGGDLPAQAGELTAAGTWRPAPDTAGGGPGTYATSLPFTLARLADREPASLAALLAARLAPVRWLSEARPTGRGYLTVSVTTGHLAALAARVVAAGPAVLSSDALAGVSQTAPGLPDVGAQPSWELAWRTLRAALVGRMARAAGASVLIIEAQREPAPASPGPAGGRVVSAAVARWGADAVRYALARSSSGSGAAIERQLARPQDLANPFAAVTYAYAEAAATLRRATELRAAQSTAADPVGVAQSRLAQPQAVRSQVVQSLVAQPELRLLDAVSWLGERVAAAARRRRPADLAAHLEYLAGAWLDCMESCPALPYGGSAAPAEPGGAQAAARLERADAARVALSAGLTLLGLTSPGPGLLSETAG